MGLINAQTGETDIGGIRVLMTVDAWLMVETMLGRSAMELLEQAMTMRLGFTEVRALLMAGSEGYRRRHNAGAQPLGQVKIDQVMEDIGLMQIVVLLAECVKGSKALGVRDAEMEGAAEAAPFGGTGDVSSSVPSAMVSQIRSD